MSLCKKTVTEKFRYFVDRKANKYAEASSLHRIFAQVEQEMPRNFDECFLFFLISSLALSSHGRESNSTVDESEQRNKWIEGEAIVSNESIRYQGFLGFGLWNGGILSTPNASQYRHWVRCSTTHILNNVLGRE